MASNISGFMFPEYDTPSAVRKYVLTQLKKRIELYPALGVELGSVGRSRLNAAFDSEVMERGETRETNCEYIIDVANRIGLGLDELLPLNDATRSARDPAVSLLLLQRVFNKMAA